MARADVHAAGGAAAAAAQGADELRLLAAGASPRRSPGPPPGAALVFVLICRLAHRCDELSRTVAAALWAPSGEALPEREVLLVAFGAESRAARAVWLGSAFARRCGAAPREGALLPEILRAVAAAPELGELGEMQVGAAAAQLLQPLECLTVVQLHEDAGVLVDPGPLAAYARPCGPARRAAAVLGAHEDFYGDAAAVVDACRSGGAQCAAASLGPVSLHSSACVHLMNALAAAPADSAEDSASWLTAGVAAAAAGRGARAAQRARPVAPRGGAADAPRAVPLRGRVHFWVRLDQGERPRAADSFSPDPGRGWEYQLAAVACIWASKTVYHERDTTLHLVLPHDRGVIHADRSLLGDMPGRDDLSRPDSRAPHEENVVPALLAAPLEEAPFAEAFARAAAADGEGTGRLLVLEVANDAPQLAIADPAVPCRSATAAAPCEPPLHVLFNLQCPPLPAGLEAAVSRRALPPPCRAAGVGLPRALVLLQCLHSVGRLKPLVAPRRLGEPSGAGGQARPIAVGVAEFAARWAPDAEAAAAAAGAAGDRPLDAARLRLSGTVAGVRFLGKMAFLGLEGGGARVQVVAPVHGWGDAQYEAMKSLAPGSVAELDGVPAVSAQGRLALLADSVASASAPLAAPPPLPRLPALGLPPGAVVCVKPHGIPARPEARQQKGDRQTAEGIVRQQQQGQGAAQLRCAEPAVGRDESGAILFLPKGPAAAAPAAAWRAARRTWIALVGGPAPPPGEWSCGQPLRDLAREVRAAAGKEEAAARPARPALTRVTTLHVWPLAGAALVAAEPLEGFLTWQVRRHLALSGHPVIGDPRAGSGVVNRTFSRTYALSRCCLHLWKVRGNAVEVGQDLEVTAPFTEDLLGALQRLPRGGAPGLDAAALGLAP
eukprot:TRINITY_DN14334_c0_g1_i3.p1 TRINITY_DN14334_c0_g1~~TRINITY_DN14334_c0_g1_i3.p1  ORF type:complete len:918 (+),score=208.79 TRINITY_DN14334_c0_g1_i3:79-2754(+)